MKTTVDKWYHKHMSPVGAGRRPSTLEVLYEDCDGDGEEEKCKR